MGFGLEFKDEDEGEDVVDVIVVFIVVVVLFVELVGFMVMSDDELKVDDDENDDDVMLNEFEFILIECMFEDEKVLIVEGEAFWRRVARVEVEC